MSIETDTRTETEAGTDFDPHELYEPETSDVSLAAWENEHDVMQKILPFEYRTYDPVRVVQAINEYCEAAPVTKETYKIGDVLDEYGEHYPEKVSEDSVVYSELAGSWLIGETSRGFRFANPEYCHPHTPTFTTPAERIEHARRIASYGIFSQYDLEERFGINQSAMSESFLKRGFQWGALRREGRKRFARSAVTIREWSDWSRLGLSRVFDVPESSLRRWEREFVDNCSWRPPKDPSRAAWFVSATEWRYNRGIESTNKGAWRHPYVE